MKMAKVVAVLGVLVMAAILVYGFTVGDFGGEGQLLFSGWIVYRERSLLRSAVWIILVMVLGNFTASLYALIALLTCRGDWKRFWMGRRSGDG